MKTSIAILVLLGLAQAVEPESSDKAAAAALAMGDNTPPPPKPVKAPQPIEAIPAKKEEKKEKELNDNDSRTKLIVEKARAQARETVADQEAGEAEHNAEWKKNSDKYKDEAAQTRAAAVEAYDTQRRGLVPQARDSGEYFSNTLAQQKGEPKPLTPAEPKKTFDAQKANDQTTQDRIDGVKAAADTLKAQSTTENENVKNINDSISEATDDAAKQRLENVDKIDQQRRGFAPVGRDNREWLPYNQKKSLVQIKEEPAAAAATDAAKPADAAAKPADAAAAPADGAKAAEAPADGAKPAPAKAEDASKIGEGSPVKEEKEEKPAGNYDARTHQIVTKQRKEAQQTVIDQIEDEEDNRNTWKANSDKVNEATRQQRADAVDAYDFQRRGAVPKARDSGEYFSNTLLQQNMQDMPEFHDHSKLQTDVMFHGVKQHAVMFNQRNGALVQRHAHALI